MNITLRQLQVFVSVVEKQSFSEAADHLFLSQSTVSNHVEQLEKMLNKNLLLRGNRRGVQLTEAGMAFFPKAKRITQLCLELTDQSEEPTVVLAASSLPARYILPTILAEYAEMNKDCRFTVLEADSAKSLDRLKRGEACMAVVGSHFDDQDLVFHRLWEDQLVMITPSQKVYQTLKKRGVFGKELLHHPFVTREEGSGTRRETKAFVESLGDTLHIVACFNDVESIKQAVIQGMGVSIISEKAARDAIASGNLLSFALDEKKYYRKLYLAYRRDWHFHEQEKALLRFLKKRARQKEDIGTDSPLEKA